jgi:hypothetical protein
MRVDADKHLSVGLPDEAAVSYVDWNEPEREVGRSGRD